MNTSKTSSSWPDWLPQKDQLVQHPWLQRWAHHLLSPQLWRLQHEAVAHCVWWRAHIPTAAAMTMVTNPFTIGFWLWLAYQTGSAILGTNTPAPAAWDQLSWELLLSYGGPIMLGMGLFALGASALGYALVHGVWRLRVVLKRRGR